MPINKGAEKRESSLRSLEKRLKEKINTREKDKTKLEEKLRKTKGNSEKEKREINSLTKKIKGLTENIKEIQNIQKKIPRIREMIKNSQLEEAEEEIGKYNAKLDSIRRPSIFSNLLSPRPSVQSRGENNVPSTKNRQDRNNSVVKISNVSDVEQLGQRSNSDDIGSFSGDSLFSTTGESFSEQSTQFGITESTENTESEDISPPTDQSCSLPTSSDSAGSDCKEQPQDKRRKLSKHLEKITGIVSPHNNSHNEKTKKSCQPSEDRGPSSKTINTTSEISENPRSPAVNDKSAVEEREFSVLSAESTRSGNTKKKETTSLAIITFFFVAIFASSASIEILLIINKKFNARDFLQSSLMGLSLFCLIIAISGTIAWGVTSGKFDDVQVESGLPNRESYRINM